MQINLFSIKNGTKERFEDIRIMLDILEEKEKVNRQLILKSSLVLMIYNAVEGTISNLLVELFDIICQNKLQIGKLPKNLQMTIFTYYAKKIGQDPQKLKNLYYCDSAQLCSLSYLEINKYLNLFSGNLDSRSIRKISSKVGINLPNGIDEPLLLNVKNFRNKLAHGETTFRNTCQDITLGEIEKISKCVEQYLEKVISSYEYFLNTLIA